MSAYEGMIVRDVNKQVIEYRSQPLKEQQRLLEESVTEGVISSITSIVE